METSFVAVLSPCPLPTLCICSVATCIFTVFYYARLFARVREKANTTSINSSFLHNILLGNDLLSVQIELMGKGEQSGRLLLGGGKSGATEGGWRGLLGGLGDGEGSWAAAGLGEPSITPQMKSHTMPALPNYVTLEHNFL